MDAKLLYLGKLLQTTPPAEGAELVPLLSAKGTLKLDPTSVTSIRHSLTAPKYSPPKHDDPQTPPRGNILAVNGIDRSNTEMILPINYPVVLPADKLIPSKHNPHQFIAALKGDEVIIPAGTHVKIKGQLITVLSGADPEKESVRGYVELTSNQLYLSGKKIRFSGCSGYIPWGTQFQFKGAAIETNIITDDSIALVQKDMSISSGSFISPQKAA